MKILPYLTIAASALPALAQTPTSPETVWLGIGQDWSLDSNWSAGLPSDSVSAVFNSAVNNGTIANINGDAYVNDLYFYDGFALGSNGNYDINISGSVNVAGNFYYANLRTEVWGGLRLAGTGSKLAIAGDATFEASSLTEEQSIAYNNGAVDVQIGRAASSNPMFSEISIGGNLNISTGNSSYSAKVSMASETVNIGGVVNLANSNSTFAVLRATLNNPEYVSNQTWGGLTGSGIVMVQAAPWSENARYDSVFTANITLANKSDQTFTGQVKYVNINDGGYVNTSAIHLTMDAENPSATQTMTLGGSAGFTTVSVKNGTLRYSAPAASETLSVSGGKLILTNASVAQGDLAMSGGAFGAENGGATVKSLAWTGGSLVFGAAGFYDGLPDAITVEGAFSKNSIDKIAVDFSGLDAGSLIGEEPMTILTAESYEGLSTSEDADEYFTAINLYNAFANFEWDGNSLTVAFSQVPEPAELAAVLGAFALFAAIRRRAK